MTSMGVPEGTASLFVDSWRAGNCPAALERETDPCSMSQLNSECRPEGWGRRETHAGSAGTHGACLHRGVRGDPLCGAGEQGHGLREVPRSGEPQALLQGRRGLHVARRAAGSGTLGTGYGWRAPTLLSARRGACTRPATTRRPSRTSVPPWGTTPTPAPPGASCSGAGEAAWTTAVRAAGRAGGGSPGSCGGWGCDRGAKLCPAILTPDSPQPSPARATRRTAMTAGPAATRASHCPTAPPSATPVPCPWKAATAPRAPT